MPELDKKDEITDPVVLAALVEDPDEDDTDKAAREELLKGDEDDTTTPPAGDADDKDEPEGDDKDDPDADKSDEDKPEDEDKSDKSGKPDKKPVEAEDDPDEPAGDEADKGGEDDKPTPKDKRQQRKAFFEAIKKDGASPKAPAQIPEVNPLDYSKAPEDGFDPKVLDEDRAKYGAHQYLQGAQEVQYWAEQDKFWSELGNESKLVSYDPELRFLSETKPDGTKNPDFDEDKTDEINQLYFNLVGLKQFYKKNEKGEVLYDPETRKPLVISTVDRTDISYEKFAKWEVGRQKRWAADEADDLTDKTRDKITKTRKKQGVRPGSSSRKSLGALKPGDISKMSDEEFEKHEAEIDRQIAGML